LAALFAVTTLSRLKATDSRKHLELRKQLLLRQTSLSERLRLSLFPEIHSQVRMFASIEAWEDETLRHTAILERPPRVSIYEFALRLGWAECWFGGLPFLFEA